MTEAGDFLEVGRDDDDAEAGFERLIEEAVDFRLRADIDAGGRILGDQKRPPMRSQRPTITFCWLPPESDSIGSCGIVGTKPDLEADRAGLLGLRLAARAERRSCGRSRSG